MKNQKQIEMVRIWGDQAYLYLQLHLIFKDRYSGFMNKFLDWVTDTLTEILRGLPLFLKVVVQIKRKLLNIIEMFTMSY